MVRLNTMVDEITAHDFEILILGSRVHGGAYTSIAHHMSFLHFQFLISIQRGVHISKV